MEDESTKDPSEENIQSEKNFKEPEESNIPTELNEILTDPTISEDKKNEIIQAVIGITIKKASTFSGPIPPPEILQGYNDVLDNGAERIMSMAE